MEAAGAAAYIRKDGLFLGGMHDQSRGVSSNHLACCLAWGSGAEQFEHDCSGSGCNCAEQHEPAICFRAEQRRTFSRCKRFWAPSYNRKTAW